MTHGNRIIVSKYVSLNPGDFHFHRPAPDRASPARLQTLLGSCVSIILWHPEWRIAGMSHSILPYRNRRGETKGLDGRYCDEAVQLFRQELTRSALPPQQFHCYLVGGGRMYQAEPGIMSIGERNIEATYQHLKQAGFLIRAQHVGKEGHRKVDIDLTTGTVTVHYTNQRITLSL